MQDRNEPITIRHLTIRDVSTYRNEISGFVYESVRMSNYEKSYTREQSEEKTRELCSYVEADKAIILGAFDENKMVGFLWAYAYPFREDKNRLYISVLHIESKYRNQKIGTKLIQKIENIAKANGYDGIYLHAEASNDGACRFYENIGYTKERIQYVKKTDECLNNKTGNTFQNGGVLQGSAETVDQYRAQFVELYFENVKVHSDAEQFTKKDAEEKINNLREYLREGRAYLFYVICDGTVGGFMWLHPIEYHNCERIYIHACSIVPRFRGKGLASELHDYITNFSFEGKDIYTHVDASNAVIRHVIEKFGFEIEILQYVKKLYG